MIYYKATQLDGTDFCTGTVDYAAHLKSGKPLPLLTSEDGFYECCTNTVYHASDTPSETLVGCSWPCRLFEIEGEAVAQEGHKFGFRTMRVIREIEAWKALGPNGEAVSSLIESAGRLTGARADDLWVAQSEARGVAWYAARYAAWDAARRAAGDAAWDAAGDAAWYAAGYAARRAAWYAARRAARAAARRAAWDAAGAAAWDAAGYAAGALVVRDLISEKDFNALAAPWRSVMGEL